MKLPYYEKFLIVLAPIVVIAFPFVNLFVYHHFSFFNPEVGVLFCGIVIVGLIFGLIHLSHPFVRTVFLSLLITLALVLQLDLSSYTSLGLFVLMVIIGSALHRSFSTLTVVFFVTMSTVGLVQGSGNMKENAEVLPRDPNLPVYIHVILDGHIGLDGIPLDIPGGRRIKQELTEFYTRHDFMQYNKAYSRYVATINSVSNLFDFTDTKENRFKSHSKTINVLDRPKYFKILNEHGYALRILHPRYLDYCSANSDWVSYCYKYPDLNLQSIEDAELPAEEKIYLVLQILLKQSDILSKYYDGLRKRYNLPELSVTRVPGNNPKMMQILLEDLRQHTRGYAHIWHLLFPHPPFVYDDECILQAQRPIAETQASDSDLQATLVDNKLKIKKGNNTVGTRTVRYRHYFSQIRCGLKMFDQMMTVLRETEAYNDAIIVVHGDHGSKISRLNSFSLWKDQLRNSDYVDTYSTLYAVKMQEPPVQKGDFISLNEAFTESINKLFSMNIQVPREPFVYMPPVAQNAPLEKITIKEFLIPVSESD
ncbi:MAG: hypothetical protein QNI91_12560 [Arenicellales bacterium]|nr:hypothetical protein [Arenicellales bacterium]